MNKNIIEANKLWKTHLLDLSMCQIDYSYYYKNARKEILPYITWQPEVVLDIGCGAGATGQLLINEFSGCRVLGIEKNMYAAEHARQFYEKVHVGDVETTDLSLLDFPFADVDTVLLLDVLEHLYNPWQLLSRLNKLIPDGCRLIASIPNSFNIQLVDELASGRWKYTENGLLDITHIRFFCEEDMRQMVEETGFAVLHVGNTSHPVSRLPKQLYCQPDHVETANFVLKNLDADKISDLFALQKLLILSKDATADYRMPDSLVYALPKFGNSISPYQNLRNSYLDMVRNCILGLVYEDAAIQPDSDKLLPFSRDKRETGMDWPSAAHSMVGKKRLLNAQNLAEHIIIHKIPGDFIETGVWRGGTCIMFRAVLRAYDVNDRLVWVADSFEGLPEPSPDIYPADTGDVHYKFSELAVSIDQVKSNFEKYDLLDDQVRFLKGWFRDTLPVAPINQLALLRLDGDMYESTMDALVNLFPKLSYGGFVIVDDYGYAENCRKAVDDYRQKYDILDPIIKIDQFGIYWQNLQTNSFSCTEGREPSAAVYECSRSNGRIVEEQTNTLGSDTAQFSNPGYCHCCRSETVFTAMNPWLRDFYVCSKCNSLPRFRHLMYVLDQYFQGWDHLAIHEIEPCHKHIAKLVQNYSCSFYLPNMSPGSMQEGSVGHDLDRIPFEDNVFDLVITHDLLKLAFKPELMLKEIMRILKPGGTYLFTLPRYNNLDLSRPRACRAEDGVMSHLQEPLYHGVKSADEKYLVKWDFGQDLETRIFEWCGQQTKVYLTRDKSLGLDGDFLEVFAIKKANCIN